MSRSVLVIEDQQDIAKLVRLHLQDLSCTVKLAYDGIVGLAEAESKPYDLIVLDLMLPGMDGLEVCRRLRAKSNYTPILMLTSKSSELDRVLGLELGADDYLVKPFSVAELQARVKVIFRRLSVASQVGVVPAVATTLRSAALEIDTGKRKVMVSGREVELTAKEFELLLHFALHPGQVYSRTQLLDAVWGYSHTGYEHTVNSHINRLRAKIERDASRPDYILTVWGVGYKFRDAG